MTRAQYIGLLIAVAALAALLVYTTPPAPIAGQAPTATFGGVSLRLEYATTTADRELGLGGRESIPGDYGMLFVFPKADRYGFWMKDMLTPIDMFWLDDKGQVVYIIRDAATSTYPSVFYPSAPALYVLETEAGFASAHSITIGTPLLLKSFPSVSE